LSGKDLVVVGLGYVGPSVASRFAEEGFNITGIDIKPKIVEMVNKGLCPIEGNEVKKIMRTPVIVDGRNLFDKKECKSKGFIYRGVGQ
jgi:UDP-N-acetyl-D-mannosaminuronate dehydrogenase